MQNFTCILLSYVRYGDHDAFLHCFTKEAGYRSFYTRGIYSAKNKKKPYLFPLNVLNITTAKGSAQKSLNVSKMDPVHAAGEYNDIRKNALLFFAAEFLNNVLRHEDQNIGVFDAVMAFLENLGNNGGLAHHRLMFDILKVSGIAPLLQKGIYLNPETGTFSDLQEHPLFSEKTSLWWRSFLMKEEQKTTLNRAEKNQLLDSLLVYYHLHFTGFHTPKSVEVLRDIFE